MPSKSKDDIKEVEENERSEIEAELPAEKKEKVLLKGEGTIEIDKKRYTIDQPMKGDYGVVGLLEKGNKKALFALHYEARECKVKRLQVEINVLKSAPKGKKLSHIIPILSNGKNSKIDIQYFTTKMFGETIKELHAKLGNFSTSTSLKLSYLTIECIEEIHRIGFVHRDIKPSIFVTGLQAEKSNVFLIGFGLARRYKSITKAAVKKRAKVHRMGHIRYMSRSCHKYMERARKDDVESWLYMILEFFSTKSPLPWSNEKNHSKVLKEKESFMNISAFQKFVKTCKGLPAGVNTVARQLITAQYETVPDYHLIKNVFRNAIIQGNYKSDRLDWLKDDELRQAGACESKIFGEKSEAEPEESPRSKRKSPKQKTLEEEYVMGGRDESVFIAPKVSTPQEASSSANARSSYYSPGIKANESVYIEPTSKSKSKSSKKKKK